MRMTRREFGVMTAGIAVAVVGPRTGAMGMSTNLERFKAIVERGFSQGDLTVADEVCAEKLIEHEYLSKTDVPGPQILKAQIEDARRSIKELKLTIEAVVDTGDTVWARSKATGVDPRSGKPVAIDVMDICRFADGKLVEHWGCRTGLPFFTRSEPCRLRPNERNADVRLTIQFGCAPMSPHLS
jgi:ketosteroid isomerase-like protein